MLSSHKFRCAARVPIKLEPAGNQTAELCLSGKCMKSKPREGKNTMVGVMIKVALESTEIKEIIIIIIIKKKNATVFSSDLFWFRLNDSKFWLLKPPVPYFFARLVLMQHRPQRWDPTSSHMRQFPSVSFWHTEHHLSELHFPPATASIQNQHCYFGDIVACHTQKEETVFDLIIIINFFNVADVPAALAAV